MDVTEVVVKVARDIALQGTYGASLDELWEFASAALPQPLDELLRNAVWSWIRTHPAIICTDAGVPLDDQDLKKPISDLSERALRIYATEEEQWKALTGRPKEKNPVGPYPFELLCAVSRAREKGLTAIDIHRVTGQDARSIFGRVQLLCSLGLVRRFPVIRDRAHTHLILFHDYCTSSHSIEVDVHTVDKTKRSREMIEMAREQSSHLVLYSEVYKRLDFDKHPKGVKHLANLCRTLEAKGCILRVSVHSPLNARIQFKCIKYLKDLDGDIGDVEEDEDDDDEDDIVAEQSEDVDLDNAVEVEESAVMFNMFYPLEHQLYSLVKSSGIAGISAMDIRRRMCGEGFIKPMSKILSMLTIPEKNPEKNTYIALERGIDFIQRVKYYRYFTRISHRLFSKSHIPSQWGTPKIPAQSKTTLRALNILESTPLTGNCSIVLDRFGKARASFGGEKVTGKLVLTSDEGPKKRGRPKKNPLPEEKEAPPPVKKAAYTPAESSLPPIAQRKWLGGSPSTEKPSASKQFDPSSYMDDSVVGKPEDLADLVPSAKGPEEGVSSLAMQKRTAAIKAILAKEEGVVEGGLVLGRLVDEYLQEGKELDRRTLRKVLNQMEDDGLIKQETLTTASATGNPVSRPIVYDSRLDQTSHKYIQVREQILSRLSARRTITTNAAMSLPKETLTNEKVEKLFENVGDKPKRLQLLLRTAIRERNARRERGAGPRAEPSHGPSASALVNIPGRSDPQRFAKPENPHLKRSQGPSHLPFKPREIPIDDDLLFRAVVISRSLYSKNETAIDWDMVTSCIPGLKIRRARQKWINIRDNFGGAKAVQRACYQWENLFLKYYQKGELELQKRNSLSFDLRRYVEFWRKHFPGNILSQPLWRHNHTRLLCRKDYEQAYGAIKRKSQLNSLDALPTLPSMIKADELMSNTSFSFEVDIDDHEMVAEDYSPDEKLVRVVIGTDEDKYNIEEAVEKLEEIGEDRTAAALQTLTDTKAVIYIPRDMTAQQPGRNYGFSERMTCALNYKHDPDIFADANKWVEETLAKPLQRLQINVRDNEMVPLLELSAMNCVYLERVNIKTGKLIANYQSRHISRDLLTFDIDITLVEKPPTMYIEPPPQDPSYIWGVGEGHEMWTAIAKRILVMIQQKPYITLRHITEYLKFGFDNCEIQAVLDWLVDSDVVEAHDDAYRVKHQWYSAFKT